MIYKLLSKAAQSILIIAMIYTGSFVVVEETSEKSEKTERTEEAIHHFQSSNAFIRHFTNEKIPSDRYRGVFKDAITQAHLPAEGNFNIAFIYTTSFLDTCI